MKEKKDSKGRNLREGEDQDKNGRYRYRYTDANGNRKTIYSWKLVPTDKIPKGKRDDLSLREKEKEVFKDLDDGIRTYESQANVTASVFKYIDTKVALGNSTRENYKHIAEKNIKPSMLGKMPVKNVKKSDILRFYKDLYEVKNFAVGTIQLYQNLLYPAFQMLVDDNVIRVNPCRNCMKDFVRGSMGSEKKPLSREEQRNLLEFVKNNVFYHDAYPMLAFMLGTGCRISETLGITWDDIDFENKLITIDHQLLYRKKNGKIQYYIAPPKNKVPRVIPLQDTVAAVLKEYMTSTYFLSKTSGFSVDGKKNFVFINNAGKVQTPNTVVRRFHGIRDMYNKEEQENAIEEEREPILMQDFTPHTLRHTFCTRMAENGIDIKVLQSIMGHLNIAVTMQIYNHVNDERNKEEVKRVQDVLVI